MFEKILEKIVPKEEEKEFAYKIVSEFIDILNNKIKKLNIEADVFLGGSFAKDTWISKKYDVDIFIRFDKRYDDGEISDLAENLLRGLNYIRIHGSRDYFKVFYKNFEFEVVPIIKIEKPEEARNVTDLSPFHVEWVKRKINEKLKNEIRLTKAFFKANNLYGAESYIHGFSGYALEILIIYYGSFLNLIKEASNWKPKVIVDPEKYYKNEKEVFEKINPDRLKSPIIIIDPVYPIRNASASVSMKKFSELVFYSKLFLKDLEKGEIEKWFEKRKINLEEEIKKTKENKLVLIYLEVKGKGNNLDFANTMVLKFSEFLKRQIEILGFKIFNLKIDFAKELNEKSEIFIWVYPYELPKIELRYGPPVWKEPNFSKFFEKWKNHEMFVNTDGRIIALVSRKIKNIEEAIKYIIEKFKKNIEEKVEISRIEIYK